MDSTQHHLPESSAKHAGKIINNRSVNPTPQIDIVPTLKQLCNHYLNTISIANLVLTN